MNILIVGNGGREHTLAWKMSQSQKCGQLFIAPGNAGTAQYGTNIALDVIDVDGIRKFCLEKQIDLLVIGPEAPLVAGLTDMMRSAETKHIKVIGPTSAGAMLEGSKSFAKKFMEKYHIPTASYFEANQQNVDQALQFLSQLEPPYVLKADGLAAGKGVLILEALEDAKRELIAMLSGKFGSASKTVVIEAFLKGIEFSVFALTNGKHFILLPDAKDYKRVGVQDTGLNTGGMGAISPVPFVDESLYAKVVQEIVKPTINGIQQEGLDYVGFVFFGLINVDGSPKVIEYNCRLGDPETEVIIPRIENDLIDLFLAVVDDKIADVDLKISSKSAATVMMVSGGYPGNFEKNKAITGLDNVKGSLVFHAGTKTHGDQIWTNGGRVLAVTTLADDFKEAVGVSLNNAALIHFDHKYYRNDIGFDL